MAEYLGVTQEFYSLVLLPVFIVLARIVDVSLGTVRLIFLVKGYRLLASVLGFFEVLMWLTVITRIMKEINNPVCYVAYPLGFALGNYLGLFIENKISIGFVIVRIITQKPACGLMIDLKTEGYKFITVDAEGNEHNKVKLIYSVIERKYLMHFTGIVKKNNPKAFYTVEDIKNLSEKQDVKKIVNKHGSVNRK